MQYVETLASFHKVNNKRLCFNMSEVQRLKERCLFCLAFFCYLSEVNHVLLTSKMEIGIVAVSTALPAGLTQAWKTLSAHRLFGETRVLPYIEVVTS